MRFSRLFVLVAASAAGASAVAGQPNFTDYLKYRHESREARNRIFLARLEQGGALVALARADYVLKLANRLAPGHSISLFELLDAQTAQMKASFDAKRGGYHIATATHEAQIADLKAQYAITGVSRPRELAEHYHRFRQERIAILERFVADMEPFVANAQDKHRRAQALLARQSMAADEANVHQIAAESAAGLLQLGHAELDYARRELTEATDELQRAPAIE